MTKSRTAARIEPTMLDVLPKHRDLYYDGKWQKPRGGYRPTIDPATGASLGDCAEANTQDVDAAVQAAHKAFRSWKRTKPIERAAILKKVAAVVRKHADEFALIDSLNCGNPIRDMSHDAHAAADQIEYFAGLVGELKGNTFPLEHGAVHMTMREPIGVCARIVAYNHPFMFTAAKIGAPLAAGNTVVMKPPPQAPLSSYRMMELLDNVLPPGVLNIVTGGQECGEALVSHPLTPVVTLIGSVPTGRAIAKSAANRLKHVLLELGGKNALIVYPDADVRRAIEGAIRGMNFSWCGQSCGSTSRLFVHDSLYEETLAGVVEAVKFYRPGIPTAMETSMGAIVSKAQHGKIMDYIASGLKDGARLVAGGKAPDDPLLGDGFFIEPTIFSEVTMDMRIAREEIFGPVLSVIRWHDEEDMFEQVNSVEYGLTAAIFTTSLANAHHAAARIESGYIWINNSGRHYLGVPFGGYKQSGIGREECLDELLSFTQLKSVNISV